MSSQKRVAVVTGAGTGIGKSAALLTFATAVAAQSCPGAKAE